MKSACSVGEPYVPETACNLVWWENTHAKRKHKQQQQKKKGGKRCEKTNPTKKQHTTQSFNSFLHPSPSVLFSLLSPSHTAFNTNTKTDTLIRFGYVLSTQWFDCFNQTEKTQSFHHHHHPLFSSCSYTPHTPTSYSTQIQLFYGSFPAGYPKKGSFSKGLLDLKSQILKPHQWLAL